MHGSISWLEFDRSAAEGSADDADDDRRFGPILGSGHARMVARCAREFKLVPGRMSGGIEIVRPGRSSSGSAIVILVRRERGRRVGSGSGPFPCVVRVCGRRLVGAPCSLVPAPAELSSVRYRSPGRSRTSELGASRSPRAGDGLPASDVEVNGSLRADPRARSLLGDPRARVRADLIWVLVFRNGNGGVCRYTRPGGPLGPPSRRSSRIS